MSADVTGDEGSLKKGSLVVVFGGSGFAGRHVVQVLARRGYRVRVAVRRPNAAHFLRPMGDVGQVQPVQANIRDERSVKLALNGADAVINLVGLLHEAGAQRFDAVHLVGAARVARLAAAAGVRHFIQVSAIGADHDSPSDYGRSKAAGEDAVLKAIPSATIVRPSIMFGPEDDFFNRFAALARISPVLPLLGGGHTKFQPVYVQDVAEAIARLLVKPEAAGKVYELGGRETYSFRELMELVLRETGRKCALVPMPFILAKINAFFLQFLPNPPLTPDQVSLLKADNVVSGEAEKAGLTLAGLGIEATAPEAVLPTYLYRFRRTGQFEDRFAG
ncbi:MAG: complex I NDUFA9 subunit family protein [Parvibaculaceae bacterium]|nr:complex I NDUFA9 subunit family protein [Parvibaculaceae bacterium]